MRESEKWCSSFFFFPLSEGASQVFWSNFFLTSPPSKCPSLSPPNEKVASVNHLVVLFASSVEIIKEMILLLGKKMDLSKKKVRQLQEHMVICNWLKIRKKKLKRTPKVFSQYHSWTKRSHSLSKSLRNKVIYCYIDDSFTSSKRCMFTL